MEQVVVEVIRPQVLEGVLIHLHAGIVQFLAAKPSPVEAVVGHLRGNVIRVARMAAESDARGFFRQPLTIRWRGVEIVYAVLQRIVHQPVYLFLVHHLPLAIGIRHHRPAHTSVAEQRHTVARQRPVGHLFAGFACIG